MYPEVYFPNLTAAQQHDNLMHNHHCLELLRQSLQCSADVSIITMHWGHKQPLPLGNFDAPHTCRNWDKIDEWAGRHAPGRILEEGWLKHPEFGAVGTGENEGDRQLGVVHDS